MEIAKVYFSNQQNCFIYSKPPIHFSFIPFFVPSKLFTFAIEVVVVIVILLILYFTILNGFSTTQNCTVQNIYQAHNKKRQINMLFPFCVSLGVRFVIFSNRY